MPPTPQSAIPQNLAALLRVVQVLIAWGRYFAETLHQRSTHKHFAIVAAVFGTHRINRIISHLRRGTRRAVALERYLRARADKGLEIPVIPPKGYLEPADALNPAPPLGQTRAKAAARPSGSPEIRPSRAFDPNDLYLPTMRELALEVRRRPVGCTIQAICLDLGVIPAFCASAFVTPLFDAQFWFGANVGMTQDVLNIRDTLYQKERRSRPDTWDCDWQDHNREIVRDVLGCLVGDDLPPVPEPLQYIDWPLPVEGDEAPLPEPPLAGTAPSSGPPPSGASPSGASPPGAPPRPPPSQDPPPGSLPAMVQAMHTASKRYPGNTFGR